MAENAPYRTLKIDRPGVKPQNRGGGFLAGRASKTASSFNSRVQKPELEIVASSSCGFRAIRNERKPASPMDRNEMFFVGPVLGRLILNFKVIILSMR
ncbi:MAG: hypothetical protein H5U05_09965 [Candidatus Aminicenantes bacterium]|nr:hypothetical protein [Candidatus Aminicenantes bacterium]